MSDLLARFADLRRDDPQRVMIHLPGLGVALTAGDLWDAHLRYADCMARSGLGAGQLVVSAAGNAPAGVAFLLACRALDVAIMPLDAGTTPPEIRALADRFGAAALLIPDAIRAAAPGLEGQAGVDLDAGLRLCPATADAPRQYAGAALLKLTSGSTGPAKAALTNEAQIAADGAQIIAAMQIRPCDTQIAAIPLSHSYGLGCLMMPLLMQGTALVLRESFVPHQLPTDARRFGAHVFPGVPFMFEYFLANPPDDGWPPCLRRLISAGAPLLPSTVRAFHERFGVKIHSFYGATETGGIAFDDSEDVDDGGAIGRPLPGVEVTLRLDGEMERIHVRSAAVATGYSDAAGDGFTDGGFLTGDYGTWDADGRLTLRGRVSPFVNVAGRKVHPDEVERVLRDMPGVKQVRVLAAPDAKRGQQIVACIVANGTGVTTLTVRQFCAARLAPHKIPRSVVFLDTIPLTVRGKTDRAKLDELIRSIIRA
jgi:acyl-CoA synthetase (AMP-forming)/AMP-acid ligase II